MRIRELEKAFKEFKRIIETAIQSRMYLNTQFENGTAAKNAAIRSQVPIQQIHLVVHDAIHKKLVSEGIPPKSSHPPAGHTSPELKVTGLIKQKAQDIVFLFDEQKKEEITDGPNRGCIDIVGKAATSSAIVVGVRSQLSSVDKNRDTLMERAFAETLNIRLRTPTTVMGEVYVLPVYEYDANAVKNCEVAWKTKRVRLEWFIQPSAGISELAVPDDLHTYNATAIGNLNINIHPPKVYHKPSQLRELGISKELAELYKVLTPDGYCTRLVNAYRDRPRG
jgi:hypothetical protein